jgi:hypothetical protein
LTPYLNGSYYQTILSQIAKYKATKKVFVTCQFGHNDQKNAVYKAAFEGSLYRFVDEITAAGAIPVGFSLSLDYILIERIRFNEENSRFLSAH